MWCHLDVFHLPLATLEAKPYYYRIIPSPPRSTMNKQNKCYVFNNLDFIIWIFGKILSEVWWKTVLDNFCKKNILMKNIFFIFILCLQWNKGVYIYVFMYGKYLYIGKICLSALNLLSHSLTYSCTARSTLHIRTQFLPTSITTTNENKRVSRVIEQS